MHCPPEVMQMFLVEPRMPLSPAFIQCRKCCWILFAVKSLVYVCQMIAELEKDTVQKSLGNQGGVGKDTEVALKVSQAVLSLQKMTTFSF